jgi:hypothetical protein
MGQASVCKLTFPFYDSVGIGEIAKHSNCSFPNSSPILQQPKLQNANVFR